jgi:hypothetical protein
MATNVRQVDGRRFDGAEFMIEVFSDFPFPHLAPVRVGFFVLFHGSLLQPQPQRKMSFW